MRITSRQAATILGGITLGHIASLARRRALTDYGINRAGSKKHEFVFDEDEVRSLAKTWEAERVHAERVRHEQELRAERARAELAEARAAKQAKQPQLAPVWEPQVWVKGNEAAIKSLAEQVEALGQKVDRLLSELGVKAMTTHIPPQPWRDRVCGQGHRWRSPVIFSTSPRYGGELPAECPTCYGTAIVSYPWVLEDGTEYPIHLADSVNRSGWMPSYRLLAPRLHQS